MTQPISYSARTLGCSRRTIQRYLRLGLLKKNSNGFVDLDDVIQARRYVAQRAKNRGRPLGTKVLQKVLLKVPQERGYYRGRTQAQRAEIVRNELFAITDPKTLIALATFLANDLAPRLQNITKQARMEVGQLERAQEKAFANLSKVFSSQAVKSPANSASTLRSIAATVREMLAEFEAGMRHC